MMPKAKEKISISIEGWLLDELEDYCQRHDYSRSKLIVRALRKYLITEMDSPEFWNKLYQDKNDLS